MIERIQRFGDDDGLLGILTDPAGSEPASDTAVLFLNAGIIHRIGPNRLNVKLARHVARGGYPALRFDLGGLGDSAPAGSSNDFANQAVCDISAALDCIEERTGRRRVVGVGLCSGADNLFNTAGVDPRLCGLMLLDPYAYASLEARVMFLVRCAFDPVRWRRFGLKVAQRLRSSTASAGDEIAAPEDSDDDRDTPPRLEFGAKLHAFVARGTPVSLIYTASSCPKINAADQFRRSFKEFDFGDKLEVAVYPDIDHTFTRLSAQHRLIGELDRFLDRCRSVSPKPTEAAQHHEQIDA